MFSSHAADSFPCTYLLFFFLLSLAKDQDFAEHIIQNSYENCGYKDLADPVAPVEDIDRQPHDGNVKRPCRKS